MPARRDKGFTLVEVLVAFTILALTLVIVIRAIGGNVSQERVSAAMAARILEARSVFDRLGRDIPLNEGQVEGVTAAGERWRLQVSELDLPNAVEARISRQGRFIAYDAYLTITAADGRDIELRSVRLGTR